LAAVSYTAANVCLKQLSATVDSAWTTCVKESMACAMAVLLILAQFVRGKAVFPPKREMAILLAVGAAVQLIGNMGFLWSMSKVGLAVTIPANSSTQLVICAIFGWLILGERVSFRSKWAIAILIVALALLGAGLATADARSTVEAGSSSFSAILGVAVACIAGTSFASLSIAMRRSMTLRIPQSTLLLFVAGVGVATMWPLSIYRVGIDGLLATTPTMWLWLLGAGVFNLIGFFGFAKGLELTSVVHASVLSASQVAMAAAIGMVCFGEPRDAWLILGVLMTVLGIVLIDRPPEAEAEVMDVMV
jgi:drug/metabolite transporter (DMT)-like permease